MDDFSLESDRRAFLRSLSGTALVGLSGLPLAANAASPDLPPVPGDQVR